ncbi:MAG: rod shape-determining protein MreD [Anaerotardibacter sp.]
MPVIKSQLIPLIAALICVVLQIVVAPMISLFSVVPNFITAFVIVLSILRKPDSTYGYAFILGLISDLLGSGPVGLTSLLLLIISFVLSRAFEVMDKSSLPMPMIASAASLFAFLLVYVIVLLITGYQAGFLELFIGRVIPEVIYDSIIAAILLVATVKMGLTAEQSDAWSVASGRKYR